MQHILCTYHIATGLVAVMQIAIRKPKAFTDFSIAVRWIDIAPPITAPIRCIPAWSAPLVAARIVNCNKSVN